MRLIWTAVALRDLASLHDYISADSPAAANSQVELILSAVDVLLHFPNSGRLGRRAGTRELVIVGTPFIVAYKVETKVIGVLAVRHGRRRWPRDFRR